MDTFSYRDGELFAEGVALSRIAERFGTPTYVYSRAHIEAQYRAYADALAGMPHLVCFAVKANSNLGVLNVLARLGAGFDIVSRGELERVLAAGGDPAKVVFSGVGKTRDDMRRALEVGVHCFNVESGEELERLQRVAAELGVKAPVSLRVNPDVDAQTHPYISTGLKENKFGIAIDEAEAVYARAAELDHLEVIGVDCHIGSQLTQLEPFLDALERLLGLVDRLAGKGIGIRHLDLGGGLGVRYRDEQPPLAGDYIRAIRERLHGRDLTLVFEPGRSIVANAGVLLTRVEYLKHTEHKDFAIVDAAMNDLIRPALYQAWMDVQAVRPRDAAPRRYDLVGPICETGDFLAKDRDLALAEGDLLAVRSAGAYGFVMSSNYNTRGRAAEVLVSGTTSTLIRRRETVGRGRGIRVDQFPRALEPEPQRSQRRSELVRGVGREGPLLIDHAGQSIGHRVERSRESSNLGRAGRVVRAGTEVARGEHLRHALEQPQPARDRIREHEPGESGEQGRCQRNGPEYLQPCSDGIGDDGQGIGQAHCSRHILAGEHRHGDVHQLLLERPGVTSTRLDGAAQGRRNLRS